MVAGQKGHGGWREKGEGSGRYRIPMLKWVSHGDEMYSIGNIVMVL